MTTEPYQEKIVLLLTTRKEKNESYYVRKGSVMTSERRFEKGEARSRDYYYGGGGGVWTGDGGCAGGIGVATLPMCTLLEDCDERELLSFQMKSTKRWL